jgi:hypothetical protein
MNKRTALSYHDIPTKQDWKTLYIRYRIGRLRHQYWLWNRKNTDRFLIDSYDKFILENCQSGTTVFYASSGYYLKDLFPEIEVIEQHSIVSSFRPDVTISDRAGLKDLSIRADNFAVVNNRADQGYTISERNQNINHYTEIMNPGCRFFYSFRDTQIPILNRLKIDMEKYWLDWARSLLESHGLALSWHSIQFPKKQPDSHGNYNTLENPDSTNGNIKFIFVYCGNPFDIKP